MKSNFYLGIDPSFNGLGLTIFDDNTKSFHMYLISKGSEKAGKQFHDNFPIAQSLCNNALLEVDNLVNSESDLFIYSEMPFVNFGGGFSFGLFLLDGMLFDRYMCYYNKNNTNTADLHELVVFPPKTIRRVHGNKKYDKMDSSRLATAIYNKLSECGVNFAFNDGAQRVITRGKNKGIWIDDNVAEAFFYLLFNLVAHNVSINNVSIVDILKSINIEVFNDNSLGTCLLK